MAGLAIPRIHGNDNLCKPVCRGFALCCKEVTVEQVAEPVVEAVDWQITEHAKRLMVHHLKQAVIQSRDCYQSKDFANAAVLDILRQVIEKEAR